ncbi:MAG TPA: tetratricopeptide repeat protein [Usitatibacteraceae bacterium]|nr:tetratricopeptide repeat protein [Usitatibacteraceae bacterium]HRA23012.1 tetratricopeptide repeat protein [Usitatibacteraceae bacterium]
MAMGKAALAVILAAGMAAAFPAAAQERRASPPSREAAMFEFLAAEVAAQRGETPQALATMARLARELGDPQVARRAVELAIRARALEPALELAFLLVEMEPESTLGRDLIASLLASRGDVAKSRETIEAFMKASADRPLLFTQLAYYFGKYSDKAAVLDATKAIAAAYPDLAEARYALGVAALVAGQQELAKAESAAALSMKPGWAQAAILRAQVLKKDSPGEVIPFYQAFVAANPGAKDVRLQLAREYAAARRNAEARQEFKAVERLAGTDPQVPYAVGLLALQLEDAADAESAFRRALGMGHPDSGAVYLGLGQAAELAKRPDEALDWYGKVEGGDWVRAQMRIATLIAKRDGLAKGRAHLQAIEPRRQEDRIQMIQIEAQLLRDAKAWQDTYDVLTSAVERFPDSFELLYDRAMAAERVDKLDVLEADLRRVIALKPDYAHAYNALGYTLADRTNRLDEAWELINKAVKLAPDDPFILDSLGWVQYRRGELGEALKSLESAYKARPDPEIAAHLGEVLWKMGRRDEAAKVWKSALNEHPGHETLLAVIQKFQP